MNEDNEAEELTRFLKDVKMIHMKDVFLKNKINSIRILRMVTDDQFDKMGVAIGYVASIKAAFESQSRVDNDVKDANQERIKDLVERIRKDGKKEKKSSTESKVVSKIPKKTEKQRKICIGWLHRRSTSSRFTQVRMKDGGSIRQLTYNDSDADCITVDFLIQQASRLFFPEGSSKLGVLEDMDVGLGNFAHEKIVEFKDTDGKGCTFKEYLRDRGLFASKFYVYLMTTSSEEDIEAEDVKVPEDVDETNMDSIASSSTGSEKQRRSSHSVCSSTQNDMENLRIEPTTTSTPNKSVTCHSSDVPIRIFGLALDKNQEIICTAETIGQNAICITYEEVKQSSYSAEVIIKTMSNSRRDCYDLNCLSEPLTLDIDFNNYNPIEHGHNVTEIYKGGKCFLKKEYASDDDNIDCETSRYIFPEAVQEDPSGLVLHHPSEIWGYDESVLVLGVVASCHANTDANYIWYRNGTILQEGSTFSCIVVNAPGVYTVEVQYREERDVSTPVCIRTLNVHDSPITSDGSNPSKNTDERGLCTEIGNVKKENEAPVTVIEKEEIEFSTRDKIGRGAFGTVYKGYWAGTQVAVKHTKIRNAKRIWSAVQNEIRIHSIVRHPNIVQIMGVSLLKNSLYIVSEYIEGLNLDELLFGDGEKLSSFDVGILEKFAIGRQICQAVAYLHNLKPPVVHRDIKPANVLVAAETHITKLCDMGLSKLKSHQSLSETISTGIPGTPHYMAPECLVNKKKATIHSDMWSLGCTLVELLSGEDCWEDVLEHATSKEDDDGNQSFFETLATAMKNDNATPRSLKLNVVNCDDLQQIIMGCFRYDYEKRSNAINIISAFQNLQH